MEDRERLRHSESEDANCTPRARRENNPMDDPAREEEKVWNEKPDERIWTKLVVVPLLVLTTVVSALVLIGLDRGWTIHGRLYRDISNARATTQIIVHAVSTALGAVHVQTVRTLFNFSSRISLTRRPMSLDRLKLWDSLSAGSLQRSARKRYFATICLFWAAAAGPAALWAGALTPVGVSGSLSKNPVASGSISIPRYSQDSNRFWSLNYLDNTASNQTKISSEGTFTYSPIQERFGYLIQDASMASSVVNGRAQQHLKNDNSNYTFIGRSYGVAASVGLVDQSLNDYGTTTGYRYSEVGYRASVECIINSTSEFGLKQLQSGQSSRFWAAPSVYLATGPCPWTTQSEVCENGSDLRDCGGTVTVGRSGPEKIVAAGWWASAEGGLAGDGLPRSFNYINKIRPPLSKAITALTAGSAYKNLNNAQCDISMVPTRFSIQVDTVRSNITVSVIESSGDDNNINDIEPSGFVADSASSILGGITTIYTTLDTSILGTMFQQNINNINEQSRLTSSTEETTLRGVEQALEALIDDYLLAIANAQLLVANDTIQVTAITSFNAFSVGQKEYAIVINALNALVLLMFIAEAFRTRLWIRLPKFDFADVKSVIIASSLGGRPIGDAVLRESRLAINSGNDPHNRGPGAGAVHVRLSRDEDWALRLADADPNDDLRPGSQETNGILLADYPNHSEVSEERLSMIETS